MLIVHVVRQFHPGVGGLESHVFELASAQVADGNRVRVVTLDRLFKGENQQRLAAREDLNGIEIVRVPYFGSPRYPIALSALRHIADADLVHVHAIDFFFDYLAWTRPFHGRKLVASTHGAFFHTPYAARLKRLWFSTVTRLSSRFYASIIAVSASDFELFRSICSKKAVFIEEGVNLSKFADASAKEFRKSIVTFGRFSQNKRIDLLITFVQALRRRDPAWRLTIAGRPDDLQVKDIVALAAQAGIDDAVDIVANPTDSTLRELMGQSAFFASASDYEGFGITPIEGLSAGLFPLLSGIPPFRRLVTRTGLGLILDYRNPDEAARQLLENAASMAANYSAQRAACMQAAEAYEWRGVSRKHAELYDAAVGRDTRTILDIPIEVRSFDEATARIDARYEKGTPTAIAFANAHTLNVATETPSLRRALRNAIVFNDGVGVDIASRILYGASFPENLNGTDFIPYYLRNTKHNYRVFMLGAKPGVAERAARRLSASCPQHQIVGCLHGYSDAKVPDILDIIRRSEADVLLVAMGNPKQEMFLHEHLAATGCVLGFGVGALFDFVAGEVPRATSWVRRARLEWVYRLMQEPRRLGRRYLVGNPLFVMRILKQWWSGPRPAEVASMSGEAPLEQSPNSGANRATGGQAQPAACADETQAAA